MTILIQRCGQCAHANYPARAVCGACLSDDLTASEDSGLGVLLAVARLNRSLEPAFAPHLPLRIGTVKLEAGPHVLAFLADDARVGRPVRLESSANVSGEAVFLARAA